MHVSIRTAAAALLMIPLAACPRPGAQTGKSDVTLDTPGTGDSPGGKDNTGGGSSGSSGSSSSSGSVPGLDPSPIPGGPVPVDETCGTPTSPKVLHRLNKTEFDNSIRELLRVQSSPAREFPNDDSTDGYDNQAISLSVSQLYTEKLERAVDRVVEEALAPVAAHELDLTRQAESGDVQKPSGYDEGDSWALPFEGNNLYMDVTVPQDGNYKVAIRAFSHTTQVCEDGTRGDQEGKFCDVCIVYRSANCPDYGYCSHFCEANPAQGCFRDRERYDVRQDRRGPAQLHVWVDGTWKGSFGVSARSTSPEIYELADALNLTAGSHRIEARYQNDCYAWFEEDRGLSVDWMRVYGPVDGERPTDTESRRAIFTCNPDDSSVEECTRNIISGFAQRAWRRPVDQTEVDALWTVAQAASTDAPATGTPTAGGPSPERQAFERGVGHAIKAILMSPNFLFRVEYGGETPGATRGLGGYEIATRLSYFLWSTLPDDELMRAAGDGELATEEGITAQVQRMLQDPKAAALAENFASQWLLTRELKDVQAAEQRFDSWFNALPGRETLSRDAEVAALLEAMSRETELVFSEFMRGELTFLDLVNADFTFVNKRLADLYGIAWEEGANPEEFRRVSLEGNNRRGLLSHGSVLTVGGNPTRSSPVRRGKFVLGQLMCSAPPPPPPGVPLLESVHEGSMRDRMAVHRNSGEACMGCHAQMDPIGLGMDNFSSIGAWRTEDDYGFPVTPADELPGHGSFGSYGELVNLLRESPAMADCAVDQLFTYAMGRAAVTSDACSMEAIRARFLQNGGTFEALATAIATSPLFRTKTSDVTN